MRREFLDRNDLEQYLKAEFPWAAGSLSPIRGGRTAADERINAFRVSQYGSRNFLDGCVSRLSPYVRHGVVTLREVQERFPGHLKFTQELAWRDYWQRVYDCIGDGVWSDREPSKTGVPCDGPLPADLGKTGLACMDAFAHELEDTGYLHNHARMWVAAWLIHWRRVSWREGARWFLSHLLDGDPASNNLSWQWVASTFSHKPYIFNRENLVKYTNNRYCPDCSRRDSCPFDRSYEELNQELFSIPGGSRGAE